MVSTWPVRSPPIMLAGHSVATRNSVRLSGPPSMQAKQPRSRSMLGVPFPGRLPAVWGPVPARNLLFTGRDGLLDRHLP